MMVNVKKVKIDTFDPAIFREQLVERPSVQLRCFATDCVCTFGNDKFGTHFSHKKCGNG